MLPPPPNSTLFPYTTLFRSARRRLHGPLLRGEPAGAARPRRRQPQLLPQDHRPRCAALRRQPGRQGLLRSEEHTSELQSRPHLVCRLLLEKKKKINLEYLIT